MSASSPTGMGPKAPVSQQTRGCWGANRWDWYVVQTYPRSEDRVAERLRREGYKVYLPKMRQRMIHRKHRRNLGIRYFPLFTRYLFVGVRPNKGFYTITGKGSYVTSVLRSSQGYVAISAEVVTGILLAQRARQFDRMRGGRRRKKSIEEVSSQTASSAPNADAPDRNDDADKQVVGVFSGELPAMGTRGRSSVETVQALIAQFQPKPPSSGRA